MAHRGFGGRIDGAAQADLVAGDRRYVDDVPTFLPGHVRQRGGDAVEHAFQVHVDHPVPVVDLAAFERRVRHQTGIVDDHVQVPVHRNRAVDERLHLLAVGDIGLHRGVCP
jgi:hypothetical protein